MKKKVLKIYPSVYLLIATVFPGLILIPCSCIWLLVSSVTGALKVESKYDFIIIVAFCILGIVIFPILILCSEMKQWLERLHISADGIEIHAPFRKTKKFSYDDYSKIYYGYMTVRGIHEWFIIISSRTLSRFELTNLHKVEKTDVYVTVKYSEKRRKQLQEILPPKLSVQLKNPPPKQR